MKPLRIFIILTSSIFILLVPKKFANACGFYMFPGEYRFWLLQPDLTNQPDLSPFFFASTYLYKGSIYPARESHTDINITEWYNEIKQKASREDIDTLLNETEPQYFFSNENDIAQHNSFLTCLKQPENKELYRYFILSKKVEQVATRIDPWGEESFPQADITKVVNEADALYREATSSFVKLRTAYQMIRLYGYNGTPDKLNWVWDTRIEPSKTNSWIKTAALYQKAINSPGYKMDYLLSKVFDKGDYNRTQCLFRMRSADMDSILLYARNKHERTVIQAMQVFNYAGRSLLQIKKIYRTEPNYKGLPFLLLREINKIEDWLVTSKVTQFGVPAVYHGSCWSNYNYNDAPAWNYKRDKEYAKELCQFILQLINERKQKDAALLRLYAAHLALLNGQPETSEQLLAQIKNQKQLPRNVRTQLRINRFLLHLEKGFNNATENEFIQIVQSTSAQLGVHDPDIMKDQLILYTARKLVKKGLKTKGLMLLSKTNRAIGEISIGQYKGIYQILQEEATPEEYDQILKIIYKKLKTPFEQFVTTSPFGSTGYYRSVDEAGIWDKNKLLDCKASWYIRNHNLKAALVVMKQIPASFYKEEPYSKYIGGNPFYLNVYDAHRVTESEKLDLNKVQVIEEMIRLENTAKQEPLKAAECYFQLANAWYNMSWHGKNWLIVKQWWSHNDMYYYDKADQLSFDKDYYGCATAKQYYLKAMQYAKDKDIASLSCFMAGFCENNYQRYLSNINDPESNWNEDLAVNPYKARLKKKGMSDKVYQQLVEECALYLDFISKYSKVL